LTKEVIDVVDTYITGDVMQTSIGSIAAGNTEAYNTTLP